MRGPVIGVDVGGSSIKAVLVDAELRVTGQRRVPTPGSVPEIIDAVFAVAAEVSGAHAAQDAPDVTGLGVVVPGIVDERAGVARYSGNLGWRDVPFRKLLAERGDVPVAFGHDVRAGGLAEARLGAARGVPDVAFVPVGTGVSAALLVGGTALAGDGYIGELGHVDVGHGEPCTCGATGCLEAIASGAAIARRYTARTGRELDGAQAVIDAMHAGDREAGTVFTEAVDALGDGLRTLLTLLAPEVIVLGGGLGAAGDVVLDPLRTRLRDGLTFQRQPDLRAASLGDSAGGIGAALLAMEVGT